MKDDVIDGQILKFCDDFSNRVFCTVCPKKCGTYRTMESRNAAKHLKQDIHIRNFKLARLSHPPGMKQRLGGIRTNISTSAPTGDPDPPISPIDCNDFGMDLDAPDTPINGQSPAVSNTVPDEADSEYPLLNLWDDIKGSRTLQFDGPSPDLFAELQSSLNSGNIPFTTPLIPTNQERELADDSASDFGIEIPDDPFQVPSVPSLQIVQRIPSRRKHHVKHFITSLLFSSPRLPFSEAQKKAVLNWVKELGARDLPTLGAIKKLHTGLEDLVGDPTEKVTSQSGNVFYINSVAKAIAKDYANPLTRLAMQDYPEDSGKGMSQVFNGKKMLLDMPSPPAVRVHGAVYFTDELLQDCTGGYFIPQRFFLGAADTSMDDTETCEHSDKVLYALGRVVERTDAGFIISEDQEIIPTSMFIRSFADIAANYGELDCGLTVKYGSLSPNPLRERSKGRMVYTVPLIIFMDDVSGNISKQWNKHHAIYMSNANLPREMLEKEFLVRFVASSPHAPLMELMRAMKESICAAAKSGVVAWDCKDNEEVMLIPYGLFLAGDNPMQAEECSHAGLNCNYFCRTCDVGGTKEYKESAAGYESIFVAIYGPQRTPLKRPDDNLRPPSTSNSILHALVELGKRLRKRTAGSQALSETVIEATFQKEFEDLLKGRELDDAINPLFGMDNIHMDTPTEILHTILLGVVKYFWGQTAFLLEKAKLLHVFQDRLESIDKDGLNSPCLNADYICRYKGGLIGKHFKSLAQVMPIITHDLIPPTVLNAWTVIGELVVLIWHTRIVDTEVYLANLSRKIEDFLNITSQRAPSILISKPKFHFLVHLPAFIRRFGPAIVFYTERYESFNHVFRLSCIYSNRQALSRDTCKTFARQDIMKHITTGGYWYDPTVRKWVRGGEMILGYFDEHPEQARLLGIPNSGCSVPISGSGKIETTLTAAGKTARKDAVPWKTTRCARILRTDRPDVIHHPGKSVVTRQGEHAHLDSRVIFRHPADGKVFTFADTLHPSLHLPCLTLADNEVVSAGIDLICIVNLQHNCVDSRCTDFDQKPIRQERTETSQTKALIQHKPTPKFFLNVYSIHNYEHILLVIPDTLRETPLWVVNVAEVRAVALRQLRDKRAAKKAGGDVSKPAGEDEGEGGDTRILSAPAPPAFDRVPTKTRKPASKAKTKANGPSTRGRKKPEVPNAIAGPSAQTASTQQDSRTFSDLASVQQHQAHFVPPAQHLYAPPPQSFPSLQPVPPLRPLHSPPLHLPSPYSHFPSQSYTRPTHQDMYMAAMHPLPAAQAYMSLPRPPYHQQSQHAQDFNPPSQYPLPQFGMTHPRGS
ncbi:hypothetical protein F4604DRAFT_2042442 [Suillus subluteus]|nr:hypothetical protein F4604DRAFT_2042442 [Suillus subluteus]